MKWLPLVAAALIACGTTGDAVEAGGDKAQEDPVEEPSFAKPPFTAEQIRAATSVGRTYRWKISAPGRTDSFSEMRFSEVTDAGVTVVGKQFDEDGKLLGDARTNKQTWSELVGHASYPAAATTVSDATTEVPAGSFECWLYKVDEERDGKKIATRVWFAKELPGAPVRLEVYENGQLQQSLTLVKHTPGG